jgi:hypothetical protein
MIRYAAVSARGEGRERLRFAPGKLILRIQPDALRPALSAIEGRASAKRAAARLPEHAAALIDFLATNAGQRI